MRVSRWMKFAMTATVAGLLAGASAFSQTGSTDETRRKVKSRTTPSYPELAAA